MRMLSKFLQRRRIHGGSRLKRVRRDGADVSWRTPPSSTEVCSNVPGPDLASFHEVLLRCGSCSTWNNGHASVVPQSVGSERLVRRLVVGGRANDLRTNRNLCGPASVSRCPSRQSGSRGWR